jgi:hypothetical protein
MRRSSAAMPVLKELQGLLHHRQDRHRFLVLACRALANLLDAALEAVEIGEHQLGLNRVGIRHGVDATFDMGDVVILEAAQHVHDRVHLADVGEELVAEAFALGRAAHEAGDVDEGNARRDDFFRLRDAGDLLQPRVRHGDLAGVRLDRAERIVRRLGGCRLGQRVEEGRLADVGQADDAAFETHGVRIPW